MTKAELALWSKLHEFSGAGTASVLTADHLEYAFALYRGDAVDYLQRFAGRGWGHFIVGRRGYQTRLNIKAKVLASLKSWNPGDGAPIDGQAVGPDGAAQTSALPPGTSTIEHVYQLRPDQSVKLILPSDFTEKESIRLSKFIESLPM